MKLVTLAFNALEPDTWETYEVDDVCQFLTEHFNTFPETAKIYHEYVSAATDVTPNCEADIDRLNTLEGDLYVVVYPAFGIDTVYYVYAAIILLAVVMLTAAATPEVPVVTNRNTQSASPNNELSDRSNKARPNARIPDIYGTVRSTPDLIQVPYKIFKNNEEVEYTYMCVGRGYYDIPANEIRDDTTRVSQIAGTSVEIYPPFTSPNSGTPQLSIGTAIATPVLDLARLNSVNGQVLRSPNDKSLVGSNNIKFVAPDEIRCTGLDFTNTFTASDVLTVTRSSVYSDYIYDTRFIVASPTYFTFEIPSTVLPSAYQIGRECALTGASFYGTDTLSTTLLYDLSGIYEIENVSLVTVEVVPELPAEPYDVYYCKVELVSPASINPKWSSANGVSGTNTGIRLSSGEALFDLNGVYTILSVSDTVITLDSPASVNTEWDTLTETGHISPILSTSGDKWVGPFILDKSNLSKVLSNFVALNGLYSDDGKNQYRIDVECQIEATPINPDGSPRGAIELFNTILEGSAVSQSTRASTLDINLASPGRYSIRARRVTPSNLAFEGQVVDEIKWRDVYFGRPATELNFGNVTTVQAVTYATTGALAIKDRKLNMLVQRKLPRRISGSTFTTELHGTNDIADITSAICLDSRIGNRNPNEIDFDSIYDSVAEVKSYFGSDYCSEFCYTFDSDNLSFEETIKSLADAAFCTAYRRGNIIKFSFEKETEDSTLLFNHRNKLPGTETRSIRFGTLDDFDGVSYQYTDPTDDALVTYYLPEDRSAVNPKEIESIGVRNLLQARSHAWRQWNKIRYQNVVTEFTATQEADLLVTNDRILVADNTRTGTQDGEVVSQDVLQLTLSQTVDMSKYPEYTIFLQLHDGSTDSISITQGSASNKVILSRAPRLPLALDDELFARCTYMIVGNSDTREMAFLVSEKESQDNFTSTVRAVNYDNRYYTNDKDYINGVVNSNGIEV